MNAPSVLLIGASLICTACSAPLFPADVTRDGTPSAFGVLQAQPDVVRGHVVQLGGRIIGAEETKDGMLIRVQELQVRDHPVYGPVETMHPTSEFTILYPEKLTPPDCGMEISSS